MSESIWKGCRYNTGLIMIYMILLFLRLGACFQEIERRKQKTKRKKKVEEMGMCNNYYITLCV